MVSSRASGIQRAHVGGSLDQHHVARVDEDPGHQVQGLLRADGDHDLVGVSADLLGRHHVADPLPQSRVALRGAVLQRGRALAGDQLADHLAHDVERERGNVR